MNKTAGVLVGFIFGATCVGAATWFITKQFYEKRAQEEIDSVKETFASHDERKKHLSEEKQSAEPTIALSKEDISSYVRRIKAEDYVSYSKPPAKAQDEKDAEVPYIISENEFGEIDDYETESLRYYDDGTLTFDNGTIIPEPNVAELIGDALSELGDGEKDAVYVRNDKLHVYYEVLYIPDQPDGEED